MVFGKAKLSHGKPVVTITIGGDELEPLAVREVLSCTCADRLVPHGLEDKLSSTAEVSIAPDMDGLDAVPAFKFLVAVKLDRLQLWVNKQVSKAWPCWVQFQVLLDKFVEMVQVC